MATGEQIINVHPENKGLVLKKENLERILEKDDIKDLLVVVISIAGICRQGKSFILNFFLRYLNLTCKEKKNVNDWLNPEDGALSGFVWKKSAYRETVGIVMWPEIFVSKLPSGEEVAIVLMDTQGTHDTEMDLNDFATIFALSTLLSSVQIYNLMHKLNKNDLISLKDFLDYGQLVSDNNSGEAPFQNLLFLIRDWFNFEEFDYGEEGGLKYLNEKLDFNRADNENVTVLKNSVRRFFRNAFGFLLPEPGPDVCKKATDNLGEMNDDFKTYVKLLVEKILKPENLVVKEINGKKITVSDFCILVQKYHEAFQDGEMPRIESIFKATAEYQHILAFEECIKLYEEWMSFETSRESNSEEEAALRIRHETTKNSTLEKFDEMKKMGDNETREKYRKMLTERLDSNFVVYENINKMKLHRERMQREQEVLTRRINETVESIHRLRRQHENMRVKSEQDRQEKAKLQERLWQKEREIFEDKKKIKELESASKQEWGPIVTEGVFKVVEAGLFATGQYYKWDAENRRTQALMDTAVALATPKNSQDKNYGKNKEYDDDL